MKLQITRDDLRQAIFGSSDGAITCVGIISATWFSGHHLAIAPAVIGGAIAAAVSMGGSEFISDEESSAHRAIIMGITTLFGSIFPVVPFMVSTSLWAFLAVLPITFFVAGMITAVRANEVSAKNGKKIGWKRSLEQVYGLFVIAIVITAVVGILFPGAGS